MTRPLLVLGTALLVLAGCTPCNRIANAEASADDKYKACGTTNNGWSDAKVTQCNDNLKNCNDADKKYLDSYADCLNKLPNCESGHEFSWGASRAECSFNNLFHLSNACAQGL
jgi:hypothetical protein